MLDCSIVVEKERMLVKSANKAKSLASENFSPVVLAAPWHSPFVQAGGGWIAPARFVFFGLAKNGKEA